MNDLLEEFCPDGLLSFKERQDEMRKIAKEKEAQELERRRMHMLMVTSAILLQKVYRGRRARRRAAYLKECGKSGRDPNSLDFFEYGLAMSKCVEIFGASWWRERKCAKLVDLTCGRGKRLVACLLHVPFSVCTGYESDVHMLASTHALASRFDDYIREMLPSDEQSSDVSFREATFLDTKQWVEYDCVILDADRFLRNERNQMLEKFAARAARMRDGSFAILLTSFAFTLRVPESAKRRNPGSSWILEDRRTAFLSYGQIDVTIYRKNGGRPQG